MPCWLTYTNDATRDVICRNLERSAMYGGRIEGVGPRYCPSIEDKIVKFPDKRRHQVFLEQEGWDTDEIYVQGMSTSLPEEVQIEFLRTIPGLEDVPHDPARLRDRIRLRAADAAQAVAGDKARARACSSRGRSTALRATRKPPRRG